MEVTSVIDTGNAIVADMRAPVAFPCTSANAAPRGSEPPNASTTLGLVDKLLQCDGQRGSCELLAAELRASLSCEIVAVGLCRRGRRHCRLRAISGVPDFDGHSELARTIEAAFDEALLRDAVTVWPAIRDSERHATRAHQNLAAMAQVTRVVGSPLRTQRGDLVGAWVFLDGESGGQGVDAAAFAKSNATLVGSLLHMLGLASKSGAVGRRVAKLQRATFCWKGGLALLLACTLIGLLCTPAPYRISAEAQIQPVVRRFVAAPFAGTLESTLVSPGDVVSRGDVLARIDAREVQWELDGLLAEHHRTAKKRDSALANGQVAEAQWAKLEMDRIQLRTQLLEDRIRHLEIRSPIDGVVVQGDLETAKGAPLAVGQSLFEIAPLGEMAVEVAVPEDEVSHVAPGQEVALRLDAYPRAQWKGTIAKIHPRSEIRGDRNVFIAQFTLHDSRGVLRPGMKGRARITGPRRPLAWNLFHRPYEKCVQLWGW